VLLNQPIQVRDSEKPFPSAELDDGDLSFPSQFAKRPAADAEIKTGFPERQEPWAHWFMNAAQARSKTLPITVPNQSQKPSLLPPFPNMAGQRKTQPTRVDA